MLCLGAVGVLSSACSIHISRNGISGEIGGHKFSAALHGLPAGFPTDVPLPDNARVIGGAGTNRGYDAAFAMPGTVAAGAHAYEAKFQAAGYTVTNIGSPSTTDLSGSGQNSTSTTVTLTGASFTAKNANWMVQVEIGSSSSAVSTELKTGEFGVNITVVSPSSTTG
jgi:hypothetical protein